MPTFDNMLIIMTYFKVLLQHNGEGANRYRDSQICLRKQGRSVATSKAESQGSDINTVSRVVRKGESSRTAVGRYAVSASVIRLLLMYSVGQVMGKAKERLFREARLRYRQVVGICGTNETFHVFQHTQETCAPHLQKFTTLTGLVN